MTFFYLLIYFIIIYPIKIPTIPKTPSILSGAGMGKPIKPKITPTINPVKKDKIIICNKNLISTSYI